MADVCRTLQDGHLQYAHKNQGQGGEANRLLAKEALDAKKGSDAQVEALKKELKATQDDAVRVQSIKTQI